MGAGAAGLATAIFAARRLPDRSILVLDGGRRPGAKILVSGGGRCNVTNVRVTPDDYCGGNRHIIKRVLAAFPVEQTVAFFLDLGVPLYEEDQGKLFPDSNQARTVLEALLNEARRCGVSLATGQRVADIVRDEDGFRLVTAAAASTPEGVWLARTVVLATGGRSLPHTGSDGGGYELARRLGHVLTPTTPALAPLLLDGRFHEPLSGIAQDVELTVHVAGAKPLRHRGALLWTHFGVSGPVVLDGSRHWHRARLEGHDVRITVNFLPGDDFAAAEQKLTELAAAQPKTHLHNALAVLLPARLAAALLADLGISASIPLAHLARDPRRRLAHALIEWPLPVRDSRGYDVAEATAGGIPLDEIDPATMQSRKCPGLYLAGEVLDVDGRIGGFNFQWAWSSAWVAAAGLARRWSSCTS